MCSSSVGENTCRRRGEVTGSNPVYTLPARTGKCGRITNRKGLAVIRVGITRGVEG